MGRGRPKKKPSRRRSAKIEVYLPKSKKQWIKDCAKGQGMSMSRYIEKVVDGQIAELHTDDFTGFLLEMRRSLRHIRDEIQAGASAAVAVGSAESVLACS